MTDYWVSVGKTWCSYCKQFVYNNATSKKQHDATEKHKAALKRHVTDVKRQRVIEDQQQQQMTKQIKEIERLAMGKPPSASTPGTGTGTGTGRSSSQVVPPSRGGPPVIDLRNYDKPSLPSPVSLNIEDYIDLNADQNPYDFRPNFDPSAYGFVIAPPPSVPTSQPVTQKVSALPPQEVHTTHQMTPEPPTTSEPKPAESRKEEDNEPRYGSLYGAWTTVEKTETAEHNVEDSDDDEEEAYGEEEKESSEDEDPDHHQLRYSSDEEQLPHQYEKTVPTDNYNYTLKKQQSLSEKTAPSVSLSNAQQAAASTAAVEEPVQFVKKSSAKQRNFRKK